MWVIEMNNQVVFAAAGHGKTYSLCSQAKTAIDNTNKYVLLISYTNEGVRSLENEYRKQNGGVLDDRVIFKSWYSTLLSEFIKPYKQATYRTNNSLKNKQYRDEKVRAYFLMLEAQGLCVTSYANTTRRFNQEICDFINTIHGDADSMVEPDPNNQQEMPVENSGVYMMNVDSLREYCEYYHPIILRYAKKAKVGFQHDCDVFNYGGSKGATYERVVIIPVSTTLPFIERQVKITSNQTRAKFYVACTRAKHSVVFAMENPCENGVFKATDIHFSDKSIPAYKFSKPDSDI